MKFDFSYGGGFTGLHYHYSGDSDNLGPEHKKLLERMSKLDSGQFKKSNPFARDQFQYKLGIHGSDKEVNLAFSEDSIPSEFEPLIAHLRQKSTL